MSDHSHTASSDQALLKAFTQQHSEDAFRTLVHRYLPLVYAAAAPWVSRKPHLKEDAAQQVFISLARKARGLPRDVPLAAWLHRHAVFTAAKLARGEERRVSRESQTTVESPTMRAEEAMTLSRQQAGQFLLAKLAEKDRAFVIARFFDQQTFQAIGAAYGVSEAAAQKRVERAIERLRKRLNAAGILSTAALIEQLLGRRDIVPQASESKVAKAALTEAELAPSVVWFPSLTPIKTVAAVIAFTSVAGVTWLWIAREEPAIVDGAPPLGPTRCLLGDRVARNLVNVDSERKPAETEAIVRKIAQRALEQATAHYKKALATYQDKRVEVAEATSNKDSEAARREAAVLATNAKGLEWKMQAMRHRWELLLIELHDNKPVGASRHRFTTLVPPSDNDLRMVLERTIRLRRQGNVKAAEEALTAFEKAHPDHPWLQGLLAFWERENGRLDQAVEKIDRALETESDHSLDLVQLRGTLAFENGDYFQASRDYHEVLSRAGELSTPLSLWMDAMSRLLEDSPEAELLYRRPHDSQATLDELMLAEAALAQSDEDTELATIWVNGAVQLNQSAIESAGMARLRTLGWRHQP